MLKYSKAAGIEPDTALLARVAAALGGANPAVEALKAQVAAILEAAQNTGSLDDAALAALPPALAEQLRAAWAEHNKG